VILAAAVACALLFSGAANAAALPHYGPTTCKGGTIRSGSYASLRITGVCTLGNHAYVVVRGNVVVGHHGGLNAITMGHIGVWDDMIVRSGGIVGLGCSPAAGCSATTHDHIQGDVLASAPLAMIFHSNRIDGRIVQMGGGWGRELQQRAVRRPGIQHLRGQPGGRQHHGALDAQLLVRHIPKPGGRHGARLAQHVRRPDANEVQTNTIAGDLICRGNNPAPQQGDSGGLLNIVAGQKIGQCNEPGI
jgi:hypothetical protein